MAKRSGVRGADSVSKKLRSIARGPTAAEVNSASINAMTPMLEKTKQKARAHRDYPGKWSGFPEPANPPDGGHIDQGLVVKRVKSANGYAYRLGATKRARYILHLLEFGTAPHVQPAFRGGWIHPGASPNPVLIPSFDEEKSTVARRLGERLWAAMKARALNGR